MANKLVRENYYQRLLEDCRKRHKKTFTPPKKTLYEIKMSYRLNQAICRYSKYYNVYLYFINDLSNIESDKFLKMMNTGVVTYNELIKICYLHNINIK